MLFRSGTAIAHIAIRALAQQALPAAMHASSLHREAIQSALLQDGQAIAWAIDVPFGHPNFYATQWLLIWGVVADGTRAHELNINPDEPLSESEFSRLQAILAQRSILCTVQPSDTWNAVCDALQALLP